MRALRFDGSMLSVAEIEETGSRDEALVRVSLSGICNTDLEIIRGYAGFNGIIGHEFVGVVEDCRDSDLLGRRVVGEINVGCGRCGLCVSGDQRHCAERTVLGIVGRNGSHAEFLRLPARNLIVVPDNITDEQAVFAEPLAAAHGITEQVAIDPSTRVAVIGDGKLGLLCAMALALKSPDLTLVGKHESKLEIAAKANIKTMLLGDLTADMGRSMDVVVEASGSESGFSTSMELVRPRGKIVLKSTFHGTPTWPASRVVVDEVTIVGSRCGRMSPAIDLLSSGQIDVHRLITDECRLADGVSAVERAAEKGVLKVLLRP